MMTTNLISTRKLLAWAHVRAVEEYVPTAVLASWGVGAGQD